MDFKIKKMIWLIWTTVLIVGFEAQFLSRVDLGPLFSFQISPTTMMANATKCLGPLGCFNNGPPWYHPIRRPVSMLPFDRLALDVRFQLYTRNNSILPEELWADDPDNLKRSDFNPQHETKIIIHGLLDAVVYGIWLKDIRKAFLNRGECNVIIVDWARANRFPYEQAVANARAVGAEVALLVNAFIDNLQADAKQFHIIGHSLGTHISGYAGKVISNLGRITGLDPAGPYFTGCPKEVRLDKMDAMFVDIIHSDSSKSIVSGLGTVDSIGDVDFFPNSGDSQPGCSKNMVPGLMTFITKGIAEGWRQTLICDHQRAVDFFISSISNEECDMVGVDCPDWQTFVTGRCGDCEVDGSRCAMMGVDADKFYSRKDAKKRRFYLRTTGENPYCLHQYHVTLILDDEPDVTTAAGDAYLTIEGSKVNLRAKLTERTETFRPGSYYMYLIASRKGLGEFDTASFHWEEDPKGTFESNESARITNGKPRMHIKQLRISPLEMNSRKGRSFKTHRLCPESTTEAIYADQVVKLTTKCGEK